MTRVVHNPQVRTLEIDILHTDKGDPYRAHLEVAGRLGTIEFDLEVIDKAREGNLNPLLFRLNREYNRDFEMDRDHAREVVDEWYREIDKQLIGGGGVGR